MLGRIRLQKPKFDIPNKIGIYLFSFSVQEKVKQTKALERLPMQSANSSVFEGPLVSPPVLSRLSGQKFPFQGCLSQKN